MHRQGVNPDSAAPWGGAAPMTMKTYSLLAVTLCCLLASCAGGHARSLHVQGDLSALDLDYLEASAKPTHTSGSDDFERKFAALPIFFAPAIASTTKNAAIYNRASATEPESGAETFALSGFEHRYRHTIGLGLASYATDFGSWDTEGKAQRWSSRFGLGAGLLFSHYRSRDTNGVTQRGTKLLKGLIGYTDTSGDGADLLHLLWIPIPLN